MKIESVGAKRAKDIFCGNHASFYLNDKGQLFAWGLNNYGQLGIGHKMNTCTPTYVYALDGIPVKEVAGG
jgi:alpha-tubulin suppressor-like RCC1 family protein